VRRITLVTIIAVFLASQLQSPSAATESPALPVVIDSSIPRILNLEVLPRDGALEATWDSLDHNFLTSIASDLNTWNVEILIGKEKRVLKFPIAENQVVISGLSNGTKYAIQARVTDGIKFGESSSEVIGIPAEPAIDGFIVEYESNVKPLTNGEATGGVLNDGTVLNVGKALGNGMRTLILDDPVSNNEALQIAQELARDPSIKWAEPDQVRYPVLTTKSFDESKKAIKGNSKPVPAPTAFEGRVNFKNNERKKGVSTGSATLNEVDSKLNKLSYRPLASCVDATYIICDVTTDSIYDTSYLSDAGLQEASMWVNSNSKSTIYSYMQFDYSYLDPSFLTYSDTEAGFLYDINNDGTYDKAIFPQYVSHYYGTALSAYTYTKSGGSWVKVGGLGNCSATWARINGGSDNDLFAASANWSCLFGAGATNVSYAAYAEDYYSYDYVYGGAQNFVSPFVAAPSEPRNVTAVDGFSSGAPRTASVTIRWTAPATTGGVTVSYKVYRKSGSNYSLINGAVSGSSYTVSDLTAGSPVTLAVSASNNAGDSSIVAASAVTPKTLPIGIESNSITVVPGNANLTVGWTPLSTISDFGGATSVTYEARAFSSATNSLPQSQATCTSSTSSCKIVGLSNGRNYKISVFAKNTVGYGPESTFANGQEDNNGGTRPIGESPSITRTVRALDGFSSADAFEARVNLSWTAPASNGGLPITGYRIWQSSNAGTTWSQLIETTGSTALTYTVDSDLEAGSSYIFRIAAINNSGVGPAATTAAVKPTTKPASIDPTTILATPANSALAVRWEALAAGVDSGGSPITYTATATPTSGAVKSCSATTTTCTITGLTNSKDYTLSVTAKNSRGTSLATSDTTAAPGVPPSAPRNPSASKLANGSVISISWSAPATMGTSPLLNYRASAYSEVNNGSEVAFCESTSALTCDIAIPENNGVYFYSVRAFTALGNSAESAPRINAVTRQNFVPNDPLYNEQWSLTGDFGVKAEEAWLLTSGDSDVVVGIIDTGITSHPELEQNLVAGYDFISSATNARDGNGRDSNPSDNGDWDSSSSSSWHGTHVSGIIAAVGGNGQGITGIAPGVRLQHLRVLGNAGGLVSDIVAAITWGSGGSVAGIPQNPFPSSVLNLSLGADGSCTQAEQTAISSAISRGVSVVVAAGNENQNALYSSPANCNGAITVAASNAEGGITDYSNFGSIVDIMAPGGESGVDSLILSTLNSGNTNPGTANYWSYQGTSMATPMVSGIVALMKSVNPNLSPAQINQIISVSALPDTACQSSYACGPGIIDAKLAIQAAIDLQ
jgi:serine protease